MRRVRDHDLSPITDGRAGARSAAGQVRPGPVPGPPRRRPSRKALCLARSSASLAAISASRPAYLHAPSLRHYDNVVPTLGLAFVLAGSMSWVGVLVFTFLFTVEAIVFGAAEVPGRTLLAVAGIAVLVLDGFFAAGAGSLFTVDAAGRVALPSDADIALCLSTVAVFAAMATAAIRGD